jgi:High potential iron-sulfur protein
MKNETLSRRRMLVVLGASAAGAAVLGACGGGALDCSNAPGLTAEQRTMRQSLAYVEHSPNPSQRCETCNFYTGTPTACGGCNLNMGNVNPQGYCSSYVAKA